MFKLFLILFTFLSFSTFATPQIKAISGIKYFPPTPYSNTAMNAYRSGALRGGITVASNFAVAKINGNSALALAKQLARSNPYTLAAMGALLYYQDDLGNWLIPSEETGENSDYKPADLEQLWSAHCYAKSSEITLQDIGDLPIDQAIRDTCGPKIAEKVLSDMPESQCDNFDCEATYDSGSISVKRRYDGNVYDSKSYPVTVGEQLEFESYQCPPFDYPNYTIAEDSDGDGEADRCYNPATNDKFVPTPVTIDEIAPEYADDLMKWHNESIESLQNWEPYLDESGNVEPQYIESYNQPDVSATMNEYMKSVASGNYQTTDASAPNYVPAEMVQPTQTAINSTFSDLPFVDPTTGTVTEPNLKTDGGATPEPTPTGTATNPLNVTGNITVNVEIPEDDTISQTEYEQSNAMFFDQFNTQAQTEKTKIDTQLTDLKAADDNFIDSLTTDITNFGVPNFPTLASIWPSFQTGTCIPLTLNASVGRLDQTITFDAHCPPYNTYIHPLLVWLLYMATGLYVFHLASETLGRK